MEKLNTMKWIIISFQRKYKNEKLSCSNIILKINKQIYSPDNIYYHFIPEKIQEREVKLLYCRTDDQQANLFTRQQIFNK